MCGIGLRESYSWPSGVAARPVALPRGRFFDKISVLDVVVTLPFACAIAIGRNTLGETDTGAR